MASPLFASILWIILTFLGVTTSDPDQRLLNSSLVFLEEPQDVIVIKNSALWLPCTVDTTPDGGTVQYSWQHNGEVVSDSRLTILPNGTLYIPRVIHKVQKGRSDEGLYKCFVKNDYGTIFSRPAKVTVAVLQGKVNVTPSAASAHQGELVRFQCQVHGRPTPVISWERNKQPLPQDKRYVLLPSGVLQLSSVSVQDEGAYRCRAVNLARERHSTESVLTVTNDGSTRAPSLLAGPQDLSVLAGQTAMLECAITGLPQPQIIWTRADGELLPPARHTIVGLGNLQITDLEPSDAGVYICSAGQITSKATLTVLVPPNATSEPENVAKPSAHTVRFPCTFSGVPPPTVTWYKNGELIKNDGRITIREERGTTWLVVTNTEPSDSGLYQCVGQNDAGQSSMAMRLLIYSTDKAPNPPWDVRAEQHSSKSIYLKWRAPRVNNNNNLDVLAYSVHYKPTRGGHELQQVTTENELVVNQLQPHTNYSFYVVAYNQEGASIHSETVTQITDDDVPKMAPEPQLTAIGSTSLLVQWDPIPPEEARGRIIKYKIIYRQANSMEQMFAEVGGDVHEYTIQDLEAGQRYEVRVLGATKKGYPFLDKGEWPWQSRITNSNSNVGLPAVPDMTLVSVNSSAIQVTWQEPEVISMPDEDILGYKLSFHKLEEEPKLMILVPEQRQKTITKLEPDTWYEISLMAFTDSGDGPKATKSVKTWPVAGMPPRALPPPLGIKAEAVNESAIRVSWNVPHVPVSYYSVRYVKAHLMLNLNEHTKEVVTNKSSVVIGHLDPFCEYKFAVRSHIFTMAGPYSYEVVCRTKEGRPSAPQNAMAEVRGPSVVELKWQPPQYSNGIIVTYIIFYRMDDSSPDATWKTKHENGSVTSALVDDLHHSKYFFKMTAATRAGQGPPTDVIHIEMGPARSDRTLGIIVGVCIGGGCIIICAIIILLRNRCFPQRQLPAEANSSYHHGNGCIPNVNGNAVRADHIHNHCPRHEMDSIVPMLPHISENENSDSKGGNCVHHNGKLLNGLNGVHHISHLMPDHKYRAYKVHDPSYRFGCDDGSQIPLQHCALSDGQKGEPITVQLSSLEDIDRNYIAETDLDAHMKASPSSSGVTDCTQGPPDTTGGESGASSQTASLERSGYSSVRSSNSHKGHGGKKRGHKKSRSQSSPHSTLSNSLASSSASTPTAMLDHMVHEAEVRDDVHDDRLWHCLPQGNNRSVCVSVAPHYYHHHQQPVSISGLTHICSQGHGPGRPCRADEGLATSEPVECEELPAGGEEERQAMGRAGENAALSGSWGSAATLRENEVPPHLDNSNTNISASASPTSASLLQQQQQPRHENGSVLA